MKKKNDEILIDIWKSYDNFLGNRNTALARLDIVKLIANLFCPGPFYYYVLNPVTLGIDLVSDSVKDILGIAPEDFSIERFVDNLHPDDMDFFLRCEDVVPYFLQNRVTPDKITRYKISYCLRQRVRDGSYRLFLQQTTTLETEPDGALLKVFGTQTDISHITDMNNKTLSFFGLDGEPSYIGIDPFSPAQFEDFTPYEYVVDDTFTRRELEIVKLLALGRSTKEIASELTIAFQTVMTHRKNMLRKTGVRNTAELVADCIRTGQI